MGFGGVKSALPGLRVQVLDRPLRGEHQSADVTFNANDPRGV